ncbi:MAG: MBL fold metallo-hydrolase [Campylobacterota bacterium]|nr:MBL fold metallo-hydrolase [Campylobacterota bacterium]
MIRDSDITITIVFDNYPFGDDLKTLWGFSCYIETPGKTILFDTGSNGRVLLENMQKLHKDVKKIDTLFLSHHHWDHIGGFDSVIELNSNIDIIAPSSLSKLLIKDLRSMGNSVKVVGENGSAVCNDIYTTGMMGDEVEEQSLIIDSDAGLIVITGCAHSGIVGIAKQAQRMLNKKIALLLGGFHLMRSDEAEIDSVIRELKTMDIDYLCPTHCTGDMAIDKFRNTFTETFIAGGAGKTIRMPLKP